nr:hypothetical protein BaRGS_034866 [Batillaria attramentaria]
MTRWTKEKCRQSRGFLLTVPLQLAEEPESNEAAFWRSGALLDAGREASTGLRPRETDSRKLDNDQADSGDATGETVTDTEAVEEEKEEKGDDDGGFGFTFSPFQFLFGYDSDEDDAEKNRPGEEGAGESVNSNDGPSELTETENEVEAESPSSKDGEEERVGTAEVNPEEGKEDEKDDAPAEDVDADNTDTKSKVPDENQGRDDAQEKEEEEEEEDKNGGRLKSEAEEENRNTLGEAPRTETSDEYAGEPRSFLETVPAASVSGEAEPSTVTWEDGATDEETDTRDRLPENSEEMKKETGINDTDLVIFKSLLPVGTPKKNRDSLFTNALPDTYPRTSGKRGYSRDRTVGDNSSMLSDRGYYQPMPMMDDLNRYMRNCDNCLGT